MICCSHIIFLSFLHHFYLPLYLPPQSQLRLPQHLTCPQMAGAVSGIILLHEKFLQFDWLRAVVFQLNLKYLHVKITTLLLAVV